MAVHTFNASIGEDFDGIWPPDSLAGGVISTRLSGQMTYVSDAGFNVTLTGIGLTYDDDGWPSGGTLTGITVERNGTTYITFTGITVDFARAGMLIFGFDRQNGGHQNPDTLTLWQLALAGDDLVTGSAGWDDLRAGFGNDTMNGGDGDDYIADESGADEMNGGDGWDILSYEEANWSWQSYRGVDLDAATGVAIDPWGFTDSFQGFEEFKDTVYSDTLKGSDADENFGLSRGNDLVDGRGGYDWVLYDIVDRWGAHRGIRANLDTGVVRDSWKGTDTISNIEGVRGSRFDDTIIGSARDESALGSAGVDVIDLGGGRDELGFWDVGSNGLNGHGVVIDLNAASNIVDDGYGNTENARGIEVFVGSRYADRMTGNGNDNELYGNDGNDTIFGGGGGDSLGGGWGRDRLNGGGGGDVFYGGGDNDTMTGNSGADRFEFWWDLQDTGVDVITDFAAGSDQLWVASWWGGGFTAEDLAANQFRAGAGVTTANSSTQRFIYNTTTGDLYFDADGNGAGAPAIRFATLSNLAALSFADIHILF